MTSKERTYVAIDLKSFYASVECVERGLDPLTTNLVVADHSRTEKTICLAVSPSLKSYGVGGRPRLFEVVQKVKELNALRLNKLAGRKFTGKSYHYPDLEKSQELEIDYIIAPPRMAYYIKYSTRIYEIYLSHIAPEDIHVYSIDEVFIDVSNYLKTYGLTARGLTEKILKDILKKTGVTATAGIGSNLYLAKIAMDILAKKIPLKEAGHQIAELDQRKYRELLWDHRPITDFWRIGPGYAKRLEKQGLYTMGDIARCSLGDSKSYYNEDLLYKIFGINAELLIDHAWGWEPCTIEDVKSYKPQSKSLSTGQVLHSPYTYNKARLIVWEMADLLVLDLVAKGYLTRQIVLRIGYDRESFSDPQVRKAYKGEIQKDEYGRYKPKSAQGSINLYRHSSSTEEIITATLELFHRIVDKNLLIRRVTLSAHQLIEEGSLEEEPEQLNLFTDYDYGEEVEEEDLDLVRERKIQETILDIKERFGKNAILKGANLEEGGTTLDRNRQIGGHRA